MAKFIYYAAHMLPAHTTAAAVRAHSLIRELEKSGLEVEVWTHSPATPKAEVLATQTPSNKSGFLARLLGEIAMGTELTLKILKLKFAGETPTFIFSTPPYIACLMASFTCIGLRMPYILDVRDLYPEAFFAADLIEEDSLAGRLQKKLAELMYKNARHVFTVTDGLVQTITRYLSSAHKISLIRNGFDPQLFTPNEKASAPFTALFHGTFGHMQNTELLLEVAKRLPQVQFIAAGSGPADGALRSSPLPNFKFTDTVPYSEVPQLLARAHIGLSFRKDGHIGETAFPVKVYECVGAGIPVIVTPPSEAGDFVKRYELGYVFENSDVENICRTILTLAEDSTAYQTLRQKISQNRALFSRQQSAREFAGKIKDLSMS